MKISRATWIGLIAPVLWATSLPFIKQCSPNVGAFYLPAIQYLASGVLGVAYFSISGQRPFAVCTRPRVLHRLALFSAYFIFLYPAIHLVQKANFPGVLLLNYLWPTFTLLFSLALLKQQFARWKLFLGTGLVIVGLAIEILPSDVLGVQSIGSSVEPFPYTLAFAAAVAWGMYSSFNRKWGDLAGGVQAVPLLMLSAGAILFVLASLTEAAPTFSSEIYVPLIYLCIMPFAANVAWDIGTRKGNIAALSLVCDFIPWIALTMTALYLGIALGWPTLLSAFLIVIGAVVSRLALVPVKAS